MEVLPGDPISVPIPSKKALKIGPGLIYTPPTTITASTAGTLQSDPRKNALWIEPHSPGGRYSPRPNDLVIGRVQRSTGELHHVTLSPSSSPAFLPHLAFDSATRKTRPNFQPGDLVYARVCSPSNAALDNIELECLTISPQNGNADEGLGPLKGGTVLNVSLDFARRFAMGKKGGIVILRLLSELGERFRVEVAVGRNGRMWVSAKEVEVTLAVVKGLRETDRRGLDEGQQKTLVGQLFKELNGRA